MERARRRHCGLPSKPFSEHIIYVTGRKDESRTAPVYLYRAAASSQDRRIKIIANSHRISAAHGWHVADFGHSFLSSRSRVIDRTVHTCTCAHGNNQFATNTVGQASRITGIWTCRCAPSEHYGIVPGNGTCAQDELRQDEVSEHSRVKTCVMAADAHQATHHPEAAFPALGASWQV